MNQGLTNLGSSSFSIWSRSGSTSCMERVPAIPELLQEIFSLSDLALKAVNARVCQHWSNLASDILWKNVNNPSFGFYGLSLVSTRLFCLDQKYKTHGVSLLFLSEHLHLRLSTGMRVSTLFPLDVFSEFQTAWIATEGPTVSILTSSSQTDKPRSK